MNSLIKLTASFALVLLAIAANAQVVTNGLIAFYPFSGGAYDAVGTNNGTVVNAFLTTDITNRPFAAYYFTGTNSSVDLPSGAFNNLAAGTISTWVQLDKNTQETIFAKQHPGVNTYGIFTVGFYSEPGGQATPGSAGTLYYHALNGSPVASSSTLLSTGAWHHVAVTFSSTNCNLYIDGALSGSFLGNFSLPNDVSSITSIGNWGGDVGIGMTGKVDDFSIFNRALTSNEVAQIYIARPSVPQPRPATGIANVVNGFVVGVTITDGGYGYTNAPPVRFIGVGSGAQAVSVISNSVVTAVNITNPGANYVANSTLVFFQPPIISNPILAITFATALNFSNLSIGSIYQLQHSSLWYWTNFSASFTATNTNYTQTFAGVVSNSYRLVLAPVPAQAFANPQVVNGFVVGANITAGGSGYTNAPIVTITGGNGTNATAISKISGAGVVTNISIVNPGSGYTGTPNVQIAPPPATAFLPTIKRIIRLGASNLLANGNYQIQIAPNLPAWTNFSNGLITSTNTVYSIDLNPTNSTAFFRLQYVP
jgi:hypothetical protein